MAQNFNQSEKLQSKLSPQDWGSMEWLVDDSLVKGTGMSVAVMTLLKGKTSPLHRHPNCHEFIYLVEGKVEVSLDEKKVVLETGDSVLNPLGTIHGVRNLGAGDAKMVISYSQGARVYEEVEGNNGKEPNEGQFKGI
ncbi:MAG TPA: cupin domain-containing protein [bacterium]|jgi:quercetin dioxygenase-like cupin family protein|nr:cupin domain-containing protein [bacterium]